MFRRVQARHYKLLRMVDVQLEQMNILVGPNATGKSTLLDVFAFLQTALNDDVEEAVRNRGRSLRELVWQQEQVEEGFELAVEMDVPTWIRISDYDRVRYEINIGLDEAGSLSIKVESLFLQNSKLKPTEPIQPSLFSFPSEKAEAPIIRKFGSTTPAGSRLILRKSSGTNSNFSSERTDWKTAFRQKPLRLALSGVPEDEDRFPISLWFKRALLEDVQILQLNSNLMRRTTPSDARRSFQTDGSNLPLVIDELKRNHPVRFQWWIEHLQTILPDLTDVIVEERPEDRSLYLTVNYRPDLRVPAWLLSDGTMRLLALTLIAYLPQENRIFMVEEPENGVHPKAIEAIFKSLSSVYDGQMFLATHSPLLLGLANPDQLLVFGKTESGAADVVRGSDHPLLTEWQREISLGSLFAAGVFG